MAAEMANAFGEELDQLLQQISHQDAENQLAFLEKERAQTSVNLAKAEDALRNFSEKTNVIQIDAQTKGMLQYIASLRASIDAKEVEVKVLQQQATPANFDLIRLETEVRGLKDKLRDGGDDTGSELRRRCMSSHQQSAGIRAGISPFIPGSQVSNYCL